MLFKSSFNIIGRSYITLARNEFQYIDISFHVSASVIDIIPDLAEASARSTN